MCKNAPLAPAEVEFGQAVAFPELPLSTCEKNDTPHGGSRRAEEREKDGCNQAATLYVLSNFGECSVETKQRNFDIAINIWKIESLE